MRRTPGKPRRIKHPYLTRKKREVLIFEIKSADSTEWARWYLDMSGEDEMRAQKITFILCIELSLKTALNSVLSGEHRVACLGITVIYLSLCADSVCATMTCQNQSLTQVVRVSRFARWAPSHHFTSRRCMCSPIVWGGLSWNTGAWKRAGKG